MITSDPRMRRTLNQISDRVESTNQTIQETIFYITHQYIAPSIVSTADAFSSCVQPCLPHICCNCLLPSEERQRRRRLDQRTRVENSFRFYDDDNFNTDGEGELQQLLSNTDRNRNRNMAGSAHTYATISTEPDVRPLRMNYNPPHSRSQNVSDGNTPPESESAIPPLQNRLWHIIGDWLRGKDQFLYHTIRNDQPAVPSQAFPLGHSFGQTLDGDLVEDTSNNNNDNMVPQLPPRSNTHRVDTCNRSETAASISTYMSASSREDILRPGDDNSFADAIPLDLDYSQILDCEELRGLDEGEGGRQIGPRTNSQNEYRYDDHPSEMADQNYHSDDDRLDTRTRSSSPSGETDTYLSLSEASGD